ncbi:hypothetical protein CCAN11_2080003 [Capnocytophaga canimorsus]|uniref:Uncharacterized protein n=1 Tax=Capnocytophaga canimorsus TaxID=28188 RepID=A0A0B7IJC9_9FLAO|nr:hypothetical protein CCAN11_2080003 [Capnocytophaga canimorsus]
MLQIMFLGCIIGTTRVEINKNFICNYLIFNILSKIWIEVFNSKA